MNVDRMPFGVTHAPATGESRLSSTTPSGEDRPAFELRLDRPAIAKPPRPIAPRERTDREPMQRIARSTPNDAPKAPVRNRDEAPTTQPSESPSHDTTDPTSTHKAEPSSDAKPSCVEGASKRAARDDADASAHDAPADASTADAIATTSDASTTPTDSTPTSASGDATLPDRMLALLGTPWGSPPPLPGTAAPAASSPAMPPTPPSADGPLTVGMLAQNAPANAILTAPGTTATPTARAIPFTLAGATTPAAANADVATDALATLGALADTKVDRGGAPLGTDGTATPASAFAPLLARGLDAASPITRAAVAAAVDPSIPLALDAGFDDGVGSRVLWMADQRVDHAEIRVTPEGLGPIDVRLQMDGHRVHATFNAAHADVRQALESGMDRLRDLLGRQGMELGQAQVGTGQRQSGDGRATQPGVATGASSDSDIATPATTVRALRLRGLIDEYA